MAILSNIWLSVGSTDWMLKSESSPTQHEQRELLLLDFGKHNGRSISQVGDGYLRWMLRSFPQASHWKNAAADALSAIGKSKQQEQGKLRTLLNDLKSCRVRKNLQSGRRIHDQAMETGHDTNMCVAVALIKMYAKCGSMREARRVFDAIHKPDVVSWNALLLGYAENGEGHISLELFSKMKAEGCAPIPETYLAALKACTSVAMNSGKAKGFEMGRRMHCEIGDHPDSYVQTTLIDMYAKCGRMLEARRVFDRVHKPNVVTWTALLLGYAENGEGKTALHLFSRMKDGGCVPNTVTYVAVLKACTLLAVNGDERYALERGRQIHRDIGDCMTAHLQSALIDMYAKCHSMLEARGVFNSVRKPDVMIWTALLLGYADNGEGHAALDLFFKMKAAGCSPDSVAYVSALKACTSLAQSGNVSQGLKIGSDIHLEIGDRIDSYVQSTLVDMYAKCGSMLEARQVFDSIREHNVVSWNALILGYVGNGEGLVALNLFSEMKVQGCAPDSVTYVAVLKACASLGVNGDGCGGGLERGREIHWEIGDNLTPNLQSALIDMYSNCGSMVEARQVFDSIQKPDVVCWTALLLGYAENQEGHIALELFPKMKAENCKPDSVTYVAVLKACGSAGTLALGQKLHSDISEFTVQVVTCLIDFYAKCGCMGQARAVFEEHSRAREVPTWSALLAGYSSCGETESVFSMFEVMQDAGFRPDGVTFVCVLLCCSHAGLVEKARQYLDAMPVKYGVTPDVRHLNCMVDVLGRANQLNEAISLLRKMPCSPNVVTWRALLGGSRKWKNLQLGRLAFQSLVELDKKDSSAYVLMADVYGIWGMWEEQAEVLQACKVHTFNVQKNEQSIF